MLAPTLREKFKLSHYRFLAPIDDDVSFVADSSGKITGIRMGNQMQGVKETAAN
jgi:hypothetical protein